MGSRPVVLVTGASRPAGIGAACAARLAEVGWDVAITYWTAYDDEQQQSPSLGPNPAAVAASITRSGGRAAAIEADLASPRAPAEIFGRAEQDLGAVSALVLSHCLDLPGSLVGTTVEQIDAHLAINVRANWLLIQEFVARLPAVVEHGRIVALTSDALDSSVAYGASKGALDRLIQAAAREFGPRGITANTINPGATDTGWIGDDLRPALTGAVPLGRLGTPEDCARLVSFLCSPEGGWISGQLIHSNGGSR